MPQPRECAALRVHKAHCADARARVPHPDARLVVTAFVRRRGQRRRVPGTAAPVHHGQGCAARRLNGRGQVLVAAYRPAVGGDDQIAQPQPGCLGGVLAAQRRVAIRERHDKRPVGEQLDAERCPADLHGAPLGADGTHGLDRQRAEQRQRDVGACVRRRAVRGHTPLPLFYGQVGHRGNFQLRRRAVGVKCIRQSRRPPAPRPPAGPLPPGQPPHAVKICVGAYSSLALGLECAGSPRIMSQKAPCIAGMQGAWVRRFLLPCCRAAGRPPG